MATIDGVAFDSISGMAIDGAIAKLWSGSAFVTPPAKDDDLPASGLADGPITTGPTYGSDGAYRFENVAVGDYWISVEVNGHIGWESVHVISDDHDDFSNRSSATAHTQYQLTSQKGNASGYAELDGDGTVPYAQLPDLARGQLAYTQVTADQTGISSATDLTGLSAQFTVDGTRRVRVTARVLFIQRTGTGTVIGAIQSGSTVLGRFVREERLVDTGAIGHGSVVLTPASGTHTYKLTGRTTANTVDAVAAGADGPNFILIEDIGAA